MEKQFVGLEGTDLFNPQIHNGHLSIGNFQRAIKR
jgi:hypothetical protein